MALTPWQKMILDKSRSNGGQGTIQEMVALAGLSDTPESYTRVRKILTDAGENAPETIIDVQAKLAREAKAAGVTKPLTPWQQNVLDKARLNGGQGTVQEAFEIGGVKFSQENFAKAKEIIDAAGVSAPLTIAENQGNLARAAMAEGKTKPLTPWQQDEYNRAIAAKETAHDVTSRYNMKDGVPVKEKDVNDILSAAGVKLFEPKKPFVEPGQLPTAPALTPQPPEFPGGMPGRQDDGLGMYGATPTGYSATPVPLGTGNLPTGGKSVPGGNVTNVFNMNNSTGIPGVDQMPQHPQLRNIFSQMRRRKGHDYKGQSDTILTSGRGVLSPLYVKRITLAGK